MKIRGIAERYKEIGGKRTFLSLLSHLYRQPVVRGVVRNFFPIRTPDKWIFLVGCYNSGTTITHRILGNHPEIQIPVLPQEGVHYTSYLPKPDDLGWDRMWIKCEDYMKIDISDDQRAQKVIRDWNPLWRGKQKIFLEKSITNVSRIEWLNKHFPNSYFLGMTRNGYCVAEGIIRRTQPTHSPAIDEHSGPYPIEWAGRQWVAANECLLGGGNSVEHFMNFKYETFMGNPIDVLDKMWRFLGVSRPDMKYEGEILTVNDIDIEIKNMNPKSLSRLSNEKRRKLVPVIETMMKKLGYEI